MTRKKRRASIQLYVPPHIRRRMKLGEQQPSDNVNQSSQDEKDTSGEDYTSEQDFTSEEEDMSSEEESSEEESYEEESSEEEDEYPSDLECPSDEEEDFPSDENDKLENEEIYEKDYTHGDDHRLKTSLLRRKIQNHLPLDIYEDINQKPISQAFVGFFAADGFSSSKKKDVTGFGLRQTEFPFLYSLLKACGVSQPSLKFRINQKPSKVYAAANLGFVIWKIINKPLVEKRDELGLPSSRIKDTVQLKAENFLRSLDLVPLIRVFLFWYAGDGSLNFRAVSNNQLCHVNTCLFARDKEILPLLLKAMQSHGVGSHVTIYTSKSGHNKLRISPSSDLTQWMLKAMEELPTNVLHPKIQLLKDFLEAPKHRISNTVITTRLSFFEYLNVDIGDSLMLVLGQDTHPLKLYSLNSILAFAGLDQIDNVSDFKLDVFKQQVEQLEKQTGPKTETQTIFLQYWEGCKKRILEESNPKDVAPFYTMKSYQCSFPGCSQTCPTRSDLKQHEKTHDPNRKRYPCLYPGCGKTFTRVANLNQHKRLHDKDRKKFTCTISNCGKSFATESNLNTHKKVHDKDRKKFTCPFINCGKSYFHKGHLKRHQEEKGH